MKKNQKHGFISNESSDYCSPTRLEKENTPISSAKRNREHEQSLFQQISPFFETKQAKGVRRQGLRVRKGNLFDGETNQPRVPIAPVGDFRLASALYVQQPQVRGEKEKEELGVEQMDLDLVEALLDLADDSQVNQAELNNANLPIDSQPFVEVPVAGAELGEVLEPRSYLHSYENERVECPNFLSTPLKRQHKDIFEKLHAMGLHFLAKRQHGQRYWGNYPSQEKTYLQPMSEPSRQIYLPLSSQENIYRGTWVYAIAKEANGDFYPLHIITKNTLGAVKNLLAYPRRISQIFSNPEFRNAWPEGLGKECIIVCVDTIEQKRQLFKDYEKLVMTEAREALVKVPNFRVYCRGELSELKTVENCKQRSLLGMMKPNIIPFVERWEKLLQIEKHEIDIRQGQVARADFEVVCQQFFSPALFSHELALTHFSLTQLELFTGVLFQSRKRMIDLKGIIVAQFKGPQMSDPQLKEFLTHMSQAIGGRTQTINKLQELGNRYREYTQRLSVLLGLDPMASIEKKEEEIYSAFQTRVDRRGIEEINFQAQFSSGKMLIAWLLNQNISANNKEMAAMVDEVIEKMPRVESRLQLRVY